MLKLKQNKDSSVDDARVYTTAMLGIQVYSHKVYLALITDPQAKAGHNKWRSKIKCFGKEDITEERVE